MVYKSDISHPNEGITLFLSSDGKCYSAGLEPKENATDNYDDHIASGGTAFLGQMSELIPNAFDLSIGNYLNVTIRIIES